MPLIIDQIGWKPDPSNPGRLVSVNDSDYVAEILELRAENGRLRAANEKLGSWMSAALEDGQVCEEMKRDIRDWFAAQG